MDRLKIKVDKDTDGLIFLEEGEYYNSLFYYDEYDGYFVNPGDLFCRIYYLDGHIEEHYQKKEFFIIKWIG